MHHGPESLQTVLDAQQLPEDAAKDNGYEWNHHVVGLQDVGQTQPDRDEPDRLHHQVLDPLGDLRATKNTTATADNDGGCIDEGA